MDDAALARWPESIKKFLPLLSGKSSEASVTSRLTAKGTVMNKNLSTENSQCLRVKKHLISERLPFAWLNLWYPNDNRHTESMHQFIPDTRESLLQLTIFFLIIVFSSVKAQEFEMFFSASGDTVCYAESFGYYKDSLEQGIWHNIFIRTDGKTGHPRTLSYFAMLCPASNLCLQALSQDTIKKYHLERGTHPIWGQGAEIIENITTTNTRTVALSTFGPKYIYQTTASIEIRCKGQVIYKKDIEVMFKADSPEGFPRRDFVRIRAWKKRNAGKYFIDLGVKEEQVFLKPTDREVSRFENLMFIL